MLVLSRSRAILAWDGPYPRAHSLTRFLAPIPLDNTHTTALKLARLQVFDIGYLWPMSTLLLSMALFRTGIDRVLVRGAIPCWYMCMGRGQGEQCLSNLHRPPPPCFSCEHNQPRSAMPHDTFYLCAFTAQLSMDIASQATIIFVLSSKKATP